MLEPVQWDAVLSRITGTVYRGTERISSNALLNALEVGADPIARQKMAKRKSRRGPGLAVISLSWRCEDEATDREMLTTPKTRRAEDASVSW
jgi:hypothetical protein